MLSMTRKLTDGFVKQSDDLLGSCGFAIIA
jgi:hypothetical protein